VKAFVADMAEINATGTVLARLQATCWRWDAS